MVRSIVSLFLIFSFAVSMAQTSPTEHPFQQEWSRIDSLLQNGLPQSAAAVGRDILNTAHRRGDAPNAIRARLLLLAVENNLSEHAAIRNIREADSMIHESTGTEKALWQSITAELYWRYYQSNRWALMDRTPLAGDPPADISLWDAATLIRKTSELYQASLSEADLLKSTPVEAYVPLLKEGKNTRHLRPTLFDLLAFRAIEFFENDEKDVIRPAYEFQIDGTLWFEPAERLIEVKVNPVDPESLHFRALHTFQQLLAFHLNDEQPDALIDADLHRLAFVHRYSVHPEKDSLYRQALKALSTRYANVPASAQVIYTLLQSEYDRADRAHGDSLDRRELVKQLDQLITRFPGSEGALNAAQLRHAIISKSLNVEAEQVWLPNEHGKLLVTYRNLDKIYLRIYPGKTGLTKTVGVADKAERDRLLKSTPLRTWEVRLLGIEDHYEHRTEIPVEPLPSGHYFIIVSATPSFATEENIIQVTPFQVSNLSLITSRQRSGRQLLVLHRHSGMPIRGAEVTFQERQWHAKTGTSTYHTIGSTHTDEDGKAIIPNSDKTQSIHRLRITTPEDTLFTEGNFGIREYQSDNQTDTVIRTFLLTDRSLYRPGQTIYFKGIVVKHDRNLNTNAVLPAHVTKVTLYDANNQPVSSMELTTNTYGSFAGKFTAPQHGLSGMMRIETSNAQTYVSVEEYKRPRFRVSFDTLAVPIKLNDTVAISGKVEAYSGQAVGNAHIKYRVVRHTYLPYFWSTHPFRLPQSQPTEVINGTITSNEDGTFSVNFTALPDKRLDPEALPLFTYTFYADVTDINGETQSGQLAVRAGYRSMLVHAEIAAQLDGRRSQPLIIRTQTLNDVPASATITVDIAPLQYPGKLFRKRLWEKPDRPILSEAEFRHLFPDDEYADESDYLSWPVASASWSTRLNTDGQDTIDIPASAWTKTGWHLITIAATDRDGNLVTEKRYTYVTGPSDHDPVQLPLLIQTEKTTVEPGESLVMSVKTGFGDTYVLETNNDLAPEFTVFSTVRQINRQIRESDRGELGYTWLYVYHNRVYSATQHISVPWTDRELHLDWATHRDRLQPGSREEWRITIRGSRQGPIAGELLANLYDASLDALRPHAWYWDKLLPTRLIDYIWETGQGFSTVTGTSWFDSINGPWPPSFEKLYDELNNYPFGGAYLGNRNALTALAMEKAPRAQASVDMEERIAVGFDATASNPEDHQSPETTAIGPIRTNLQETAFFFPQLQTDEEGNVTIRFTVPEALTEWKFMAFAHTPDWKTGHLQGFIKTQKELMVTPNLPRFLRQGDQIQISTKISNLSDRSLTGAARLELLDPITHEPIDGFGNLTETGFEVTTGQSTAASWTLQVPEDRFDPIIIRITAKADNFSDGEENMLPVVTNRILVTETLPLSVDGGDTISFTLDRLVNQSSDTRLNHALTVEFTGNPAWYAVQALPTLLENADDCAEHVFQQFYANALAAHILERTPRVKAVMDQWRAVDTTTLLSSLEKNAELKSALLAETPWVIEANDEREQKRRIALLFDTYRLSQGLRQSLDKLVELQLSDGSFPWFRGMSSDRYITQYIAAGIARLQRLGVTIAKEETAIAILANALGYIDRQVTADYDRLTEEKVDLKKSHIQALHAHYLYLRSLTPDHPVPDYSQAAHAFYLEQASRFWVNFGPYVKGQLALALHRLGNQQASRKIVASLRETAVDSPELGMHWKATDSYRWYDAPIEGQALLIEAFKEIAADDATVDRLRFWLLKQKQTQHWRTSKATADAVYALLLQGTDWLAAEPNVTLVLGNRIIRSASEGSEAGTHYFKTRIEGAEVTSDMGNIRVAVDQPVANGTAWGAVYWQYFETLDQITSASTPLTLSRQLYIERNTDRGPVLEEIAANNPLRVGDRVKVRLTLYVDREMEYVHLKDLRATCFEPVNTLSGFRYQNGIGYYENTRDVATHFFFDRVRPGTYVFEYMVYVAQVGDFSDGISTIQCMYAPEFSSHSQGDRIKVRDN